MTDLRQLLGANLKIYRKSNGFSQSKLAERVNTATNYISAIEAGRRFPSVEMLEKIALALKIDTPELFSMKPIQIDTAKKKLEKQIWQDVGKNLSDYITGRVAHLKP
jgi:transcriptional regulator with XRE-family HTH domain